MNNFTDFLGIFIIGWAFVYVAHMVIGGLLSIFYRRFANDDKIAIWFK